jgi:hypothetical protein
VSTTRLQGVLDTTLQVTSKLLYLFALHGNQLLYLFELHGDKLLYLFELHGDKLLYLFELHGDQLPVLYLFELHGDQLVSLLLESFDDLSDQSAMNAVRLDHDEGALGVGHFGNAELRTEILRLTAFRREHS